MKNNLTIICIYALILCSCSTSLKEIEYISHHNNNSNNSNNNYDSNSDNPCNSNHKNYKLQEGDNIYVRINSENQLLSELLNNNISTNSTVNESSISLISHTIDKNGSIDIPLIGRIKVSNMSLQQAKAKITDLVSLKLNDANVTVKLVNKQITVLGEVRTPGKHQMIKDRISIFEALGLAGDLTDFANRKNIKLIRHIDKDKDKVIELDITDKNTMCGEYYYIFPNDVLYVSQRDRIFGTKTLPFSSTFGITTSVISTIISLILLVK